jgi:hypothetical protein
MITPAPCSVSRSPWRTDHARNRAAFDRSSATFNALISLSDTVPENSVHANMLQVDDPFPLPNFVENENRTRLDPSTKGETTRSSSQASLYGPDEFVPITLPITGGCYCGNIRYESTAQPLMMIKCHCRDCRHITGAPYAPAAIFPAAAFRLTKSELRYHFTASIAGGKHKRGFCPSAVAVSRAESPKKVRRSLGS